MDRARFRLGWTRRPEGLPGEGVFKELPQAVGVRWLTHRQDYWPEGPDRISVHFDAVVVSIRPYSAAERKRLSVV